jgi:signal transduction histidine kinase
MKNHHDLSTIYELTGNYQDALINHKIYSQLKDSIFTDQSRQTLQEIETKYEIAQTEAEIALLTREKEAQMLKLQRSQLQMIFFLAASAMLVVLVFILISRYRIKQHANRQLQLLNATKDRFFTIIAHDLKNPLIAFRNITLGLKNALPQLQPQEISCYMDEIHRSADQLNELLANLLQWSRSQTGLIKQCKRNILVKDLVDTVLQSLDAEIRQKGITISTMTEPSDQIFADENMVSAVLRNIVSNAVRFSDNNKEITIQTNRENHTIYFHVEDQGPGLTENEIQKLFRIDADTKSIGAAAKKGTGLGLILCKELLDKEGGKIWVRSVKGKGSTFSFTIPA